MEATIELDNGYTLEVWRDTYADSPRDWDNLGHMACAHRRYSLGDAQMEAHGVSLEDDFKRFIALQGGLNLKDVIYLPLYLYDHSGLTMNTTGFSCHWDSGQVGYIYVPLDKVREEYGVKRVSRVLREKIGERLRGEVEIYDMDLQGAVWGLTILDEEGEAIDSCWGFYGEENLQDEIDSWTKHYNEKAA